MAGFNCHGPSSRYYSIDKAGQRRYCGRNKDSAIYRYRAGLKLWTLRQMTDDEAVDNLVDMGVDAWKINPELTFK